MIGDSYRLIGKTFWVFFGLSRAITFGAVLGKGDDGVNPTLPVVVTAKDAIADGVVRLTLRHPEDQALPGWSPGAHIDLHLGPGLVRQYSLCGDPGDRTSWQVAVAREEAGRGGSRHVHDLLLAGEVLTAGGPRNNFPLRPAEGYLFVAGGIGITPLVPMVAAAERARTPWRLVYGGRTRASMAFLDELGPHGAVEIVPQDERGMLDLEVLAKETRPGMAVYCCGPAGLLSAVEERCADLAGVTLHVERFSPVETAPGDEGDFEVELARSGLVLPVRAGQSILDVVEAAGIATMSSCRDGTCGSCETPELSGRPVHRDSVLAAAERAAGTVMMICVSRGEPGRLVLDL